MFFKPCKGAIAFSNLRATSVSSCAGAAPGKEALTATVGSSRSGNCCTFMDLKAKMPANVSITKSMTAGIGFFIDHAETFIAIASYLAAAAGAGTTLTKSPWLKKLPPLATNLSSGPTPVLISRWSPTMRPVCTLSWLTKLSAPTRYT